MTKLDYVDLERTLLLAMPFNLYEADQDPTFGMSPHLMPVVTEHWLTYKVVFRDRFGNALLRSYSWPNTVSPLRAELWNQRLERKEANGTAIIDEKGRSSTDVGPDEGGGADSGSQGFSWGDFQLEPIQLFQAQNSMVQCHVVRNRKRVYKEVENLEPDNPAGALASSTNTAS